MLYIHFHVPFETPFTCIPSLSKLLVNMGSDIPLTEVDNIAGIVRYFSDGSVKRSDPTFDIAAADKGSVAWEDVEFDKAHRLSARVYKPSAAAGKLPIFVYLHGGGFCVGSCTWPNCHNYCHHLADRLQVIVVAPNYRLAPENRLPAAIDDGLAAMSWLRDEAQASEGWLAGAADFGKVVVCGDSAGGNIAHHLAVKIGGGSADLDPIRVRGYILVGPFFGGSVRTRSEMECPKDAFLNLEINDRYV